MYWQAFNLILKHLHVREMFLNTIFLRFIEKKTKPKSFTKLTKILSSTITLFFTSINEQRRFQWDGLNVFRRKSPNNTTGKFCYRPLGIGPLTFRFWSERDSAEPLERQTS